MILGIITIVCIFVYAIWNVYNFKENWYWDKFICFMGLFVSSIIAFFVWLMAGLIYFVPEKQIGEDLVKKQDIYSIKDSSSISGVWSLFGGKIDEVDYYYYWVETDKGKHREKMKADSSYVIEEDIEQPYYEEFKPICKQIDGYKSTCMFKDNTYVFHIPKGSIKYEYNLD